jgi:uncharacterized coiled-coil protein SlyX
VVESERRSMADRLRYKEKELAEREEKVKRMYDELVNEWKEADRSREKFRSSTTHYSAFMPTVSSPKSVR